MFAVHREKYFGIIFRYILWLIFELIETYYFLFFLFDRSYDQDERLNERFLVACIVRERRKSDVNQRASSNNLSKVPNRSIKKSETKRI